MPLKIRDLRGTAALVLAVLILAPAAGTAETLADTFRQWAEAPRIERQMSLRDLGIDQPVLLRGEASEQSLFLPVPAGLAIEGAELALEARYVRGHAGTTSVLWSDAGDPLAARQLTESAGSADARLALEGHPRNDGFARVDIGWWSVVSADRCSDTRAQANVMRVAPDSTFRYRFDGAAVRDVRTLISALPPRVRLLVHGAALDAAAYDAAWRIGSVLAANGRQVDVIALPKIGDRVAVDAAAIPAPLRALTAYAALADAGGTHALADAAELGAWLSLPGSSIGVADVVIADAALRERIGSALDALAAAVAAAEPDAREAFAAWRAGLDRDLAKSAEASLVAAHLGGRPVLVVRAENAAEAAGALGRTWRDWLRGAELGVDAAETPRARGSVLVLDRLGAFSGSFDVVAQSDRRIAFELGALADDGKLPSAVVLDLAAAPDVSGQRAVAAIHFNDYLIGAGVLDADGGAQRMRAAIPAFALRAHNEVRVSFLRQPERGYCADPAIGYPVSILPASHIEFRRRDLAPGFVAAAARFARGSSLFVPAAWLDDAPASLAKVIAIAAATGVAPHAARLEIAEGDAAIVPRGDFLAFARAPAGVEPAARGDGRLIVPAAAQPLLDLAGVGPAAVLQAVTSGGHVGVIYNDVDAKGPDFSRNVRLGGGDFALLDASGRALAREIVDADGAALVAAADPTPWWRQHMVWLALLVGLVSFALLAARVAHVRRRRAAAKAQ